MGRTLKSSAIVAVCVVAMKERAWKTEGLFSFCVHSNFNRILSLMSVTLPWERREALDD